MSDSEIFSSKFLTRRSLFKLPGLAWLASCCGGLALADVPASERGRAGSPVRRSMTLNGVWSLTYGLAPNGLAEDAGATPPAGWTTIPAMVPGNVELDMVAAGRLEPLERGEHVYQTLNLEGNQWWYRRSFLAEAGAPGETAELVFEGMDCLGTVWLNGQRVGQAANALIPHHFDVTPLLRTQGANELAVRLDPVNYMDPLRVRKAPHVFGWDIMPRIVSAGLWREVRLEWLRPKRIATAYWVTELVDVAKRRAMVTVEWETVGIAESGRPARLEIDLSRNGCPVFHVETATHTSTGRHAVSLDGVDFWWPCGYGEPVLYDAVLTLMDDSGMVLDRHWTRLGIRTVELQRTDIATQEEPGKFVFVVNGVSVFAKGADWSALDALHSRDPEHLDSVFPMLVEMNCNIVRCWGGNVYASDRLLDLCDEHGILLWQDFAMACAVYPQDDDFQRVIAAEAESVVTRMRNHACLALWCGNNECDDAVTGFHQAPGATLADPNDDRISRVTLPAVVKRLDPHRSYLPSSPYHSPTVVAAGNNLHVMPEVHLWGPRGYFKTPFYMDEPAPFVSEIGYHGCPARSTLERMLDPKFVYPWVRDHEWNDEWLTKSVRFRPDSKTTVGRNDLMIKQMQDFFGIVPDDLDEFIAASQICQAEAMKFFVEFWRQNKGAKSGIVWWNLRDGWPILSDAIVDFYNNKKLAFRYIQRAQRNVQAICCEPRDGRHAMVVVNDTRMPARGKLRVWRIGDGKPLAETQFRVQPNGVAKVGELTHPATTEMWHYEWMTESFETWDNHYLAVTGPVDFGQYKQWMRAASLLPIG